jgi:hypothetical protein
VFTRQDFPEDGAKTQNNLAGTYRDRIRGKQADNLKQAIAYYQQVLETYTYQDFFKNWAVNQYYLATIYKNCIINFPYSCQQFMKVFSQVFPKYWAMIRNNFNLIIRME